VAGYSQVKEDRLLTAHVCGINIGKTVFHLVGLSEQGQIVLKKRLSRRQLITLTVNMPASLIGMEACAGSHLRRVCAELKVKMSSSCRLNMSGPLLNPTRTIM
jgi:hypothetical protein